MSHPFISDLSAKSMEELQATITQLLGKLTFAQRMQNRAMVNQLYMVIDSYKSEYNKRMDELLNKHNANSKISVKKEG
jgi:predicted nucleotide-binding protein (sugar kinase/HSP70/actin superfamily)